MRLPPVLRRALFSLAVLGLLLAGAGFAWFQDAASAPPAAPLPATDGIAVLTGGPDRVEAGLRLALGRPEARLIVSGVGEDADLAALTRVAGVEPYALLGRVHLGREARSTRGNAVEVAAWARAEGLRSVTVVTAGFHMPRAMLELRRAAPGVELVPYPVQPFHARPPAMLREYAKLAGAWMGLSSLSRRR
ncbi:YdcF family protein [Roseomonas sp. OT10]|uniref:YdcF family protein n=1 Tax=Roseomonas cutis TaxID=2897332 RepID=UPI001E44A5DB|nr:YdcF family protein [Roseomonas sp. OT10]UFN47332.1 YdcF family protein [Roseomonas sp. OT10]